MVNIGKLYSVLGNPSSLQPLLLKDTCATVGMVTGSSISGGKEEEGLDRAIDEVGTECIWLLGIPASKQIINYTGFKALGLDHNFDPRNLKNKDVFEKIKQYAPDEKVKQNMLKIEKKQTLFKNAVSARFFASTAMAVMAYIGLTKFKHQYTEKKIRKNLIAEHNKAKETEQNKTPQNKEITFKGAGNCINKGIEYFAFDPVRNMWILDGCITGERLKDSRTPQEFVGYGIKEASTLCFMYYAGEKIQKYFENNANTKHNKNISFDARVLENNTLQNMFDNKSIEKSLADFEKVKGKPAEIFEFIIKNPDNDIVKVAKESDMIKLYKKTQKVDTRKYIDLKEIENLSEKISTLYSQYNAALKNGDSSEKFFSGVKKLKRHSIRMNIGTCIFALGVLTPGIMLLKRYTDKSGSDFQTKREIKEKLIKEGVIS